SHGLERFRIEWSQVSRARCHIRDNRRSRSHEADSRNGGNGCPRDEARESPLHEARSRRLLRIRLQLRPESPSNRSRRRSPARLERARIETPNESAPPESKRLARPARSTRTASRLSSSTARN